LSTGRVGNDSSSGNLPSHKTGGIASPFLTVPEVAALLRVPTSRVYEWTRRVGPDAIPRYRAGKHLTFLSDEVMRWFTTTQRIDLNRGLRTRRMGLSARRRRHARAEPQAAIDMEEADVSGDGALSR
jgi:excisionase family DNA binding protein